MASLTRWASIPIRRECRVLRNWLALVAPSESEPAWLSRGLKAGEAMGGVARMVSFIRKGGRLSERYGISGSEAWPASRALLDVEVLSCSLLIVFLLCFRTSGSFGQ